MSIRDGLPYGWWKNPDFWATLLLIPTLIMLMFLLAVWFL